MQWIWLWHCKVKNCVGVSRTHKYFENEIKLTPIREVFSEWFIAFTENDFHLGLFSLGTLTVEEVYKDRDQFAALVREVAAPDVGRMGIEILSFTIKDVYDDVQYLQSLGKAQTASVKRDADSGVAEANRYEEQIVLTIKKRSNPSFTSTEMLESAKLNAKKLPWT